MRWLILIIAVALGGCADSPWSGPTESQRAAEEAKNIPPVSYKADLVAFMRTYLNDPTNVRGAMVAAPAMTTVGSFDRFVACLRFNAKSGGGQYAGVKDAAAVFVSGKLDRLIELSAGGVEETERNKPLREFCGNAVYQPFPELERLTR